MRELPRACKWGDNLGNWACKTYKQEILVNVLGGALLIDYFSSHHHPHVKPYLQILDVSFML